MGRVLKFTRAETEGVTRFGRDFLEEFPEEPVESANAAQDPAQAMEELPPFDPDAIREEIMAAARVDAEAMVKEAYKEGLSRGMDAGRQQFDASIAKCADALKAATEALEKSQSEFLNHLEPQVLALVKLLVTHVLGAELQTNPEVVQTTVRRALDLLAGQNTVSLLLHPDDVDAIRRHQVTLLDNVAGVNSLQLIPSDEVEPGGCIARSEAMEVDGRLESLLEQVLDALTE